MAANEDMRLQFHAIITDWLRQGFVEYVDPDKAGRGYYIPTFMVIRLDKSSSQYRMVVNAARLFDGICLNDCLGSGPNKIASLLRILIRFRRFLYALNLDIKQMFMMLRLKEDDKRYVRFPYRTTPSEPMAILECTRHAFGLVSSPFNAVQAVQHHASCLKEKYPYAHIAMVQDMLMDDIIVSHDDIPTLDRLRHDVEHVLESMDMSVHKACSNSPDLLQAFRPEQIAKSRIMGAEENPLGAATDPERPCPLVKALGLSWDASKDTLSLTMPKPPQLQFWTLRLMSSWAGKFFDPLGLFAPIVVVAKKIIRTVWRERLTWDQHVPESIRKPWTAWCRSAYQANTIEMPRCVKMPGTVKSEDLLHFVDASADAQAAVTYVRTEYEDGRTLMRLLCARTKLATLRRPESIPRKEAVAAVLGTEQALDVAEAWKVRITDAYFFTDSYCVLFWLHTYKPLQIFVANRVCKILDRTNLHQWNYVHTLSNPADAPSRGLTASQLDESDLWKFGPKFALKPKHLWPAKPDFLSQPLPEAESEVRTIMNIHFQTLHNDRNLITPFMLALIAEKASLHQGVGRLATWKLPFRHRQDPSVSHPEMMDEIYTLWVQQVQRKHIPLDQYGATSAKWAQLGPFMDSEGIIRAQSNLRRGHRIPYGTRNPVILPDEDELTLAILQKIHEIDCNHVGGAARLLNTARRRYWIPRGPTLCNTVIKRCAHCARRSPNQMKAAPPPIHWTRVGRDKIRAFCHIGLDMCGPFLTKNSGGVISKRWILVLDCTVTRACNWEVLYTADAHSFALAFRRHVFTYGCPDTINSDCGKNFIPIRKQLQAFISDTFPNINWHANTPLAPRFGGHFEIFMRLGKRAMKHILPTAKVMLSDEQFITVCREVQYHLNQRPLTCSASDLHQGPALTPADFLLGTCEVYGKIMDEHQGHINRQEHLLQIEELLDQVRNRMSEEYHTALRDAHRRGKTLGKVSVGDLVLVLKSAGKLSKHYTLGEVVKCNPDEDGILRTIDVAITKSSKNPQHKLGLKRTLIQRSIDGFLLLPKVPQPQLDRFGPTLEQLNL